MARRSYVEEKDEEEHIALFSYLIIKNHLSIPSVRTKGCKEERC